jgi:hypothetical protein
MGDALFPVEAVQVGQVRESLFAAQLEVIVIVEPEAKPQAAAVRREHKKHERDQEEKISMVSQEVLGQAERWPIANAGW